jgi:ankyrin repeat protein
MLMVASSIGDTDLVDFLLSRNADVDYQNGSGGTALMFATYIGNEAIVRQLCRAGADLSLVKSDGRTALQVARLEGHEACETALYDEIAHHARFNQPRHVEERTKSKAVLLQETSEDAWRRLARILRLTILTKHKTLAKSAANGRLLEVQRATIVRGGDVLAKWNKQLEATQRARLPERMLAAAKSNDTAAVAVWLDGCGNNIDALWDTPDASARRGTMLMVACSQGHEELTELLLERGANVDHQDSNGVTPLMCAVCYSRTSIARRLLRMGASTKLCDVNGSTAYEWALEASDGSTSGCVRAFLERQWPRTIMAWT